MVTEVPPAGRQPGHRDGPAQRRPRLRPGAWAGESRSDRDLESQPESRSRSESSHTQAVTVTIVTVTVTRTRTMTRIMDIPPGVSHTHIRKRFEAEKTFSGDRFTS